MYTKYPPLFNIYVFFISKEDIYKDGGKIYMKTVGKIYMKMVGNIYEDGEKIYEDWGKNI